MKFYCIADENTVRGFRLAAVEGRVVIRRAEAAAAVEAAVAQRELDILILTERVADGIRATSTPCVVPHRARLIVEIPGPDRPDAGSQEPAADWRRRPWGSASARMMRRKVK